MKGKTLTPSEVLDFSPGAKRQGTVRRYYLQWRVENGLPLRCDNPECTLHTSNPQWNGSALPLILDHIDGNRAHNRPNNLRLLCPNCDSQLETRGGKNKGRIKNQTMHGFHIIDKATGRNDVQVFLRGQTITFHQGAISANTEDKS